MIDLRGEGDSRWLERVLWGKCEEEVECAHLREVSDGSGELRRW